MLPGKANIELKSGADFVRNIYLKDENGAAKDLTGYTARMEVRTSPGGALLLALSTDAGEGITITPASGLITIEIGGADTAELPYKSVYDLFLFLSAARSCILEGEVINHPRVTR